jgi:hypothetical protein
MTPSDWIKACVDAEALAGIVARLERERSMLQAYHNKPRVRGTTKARIKLAVAEIEGDLNDMALLREVFRP